MIKLSTHSQNIRSEYRMGERDILLVLAHALALLDEAVEVLEDLNQEELVERINKLLHKVEEGA